ncbi:hypothetical protein SCHPADRAFT_597762 [Schizopora paradoxa]|uniref:AAA+ ATPase domain-containing protein n=1 Tax=Schizopora paradoxa TaxID=27342 RepID=A0A0H2RAA2_9AGAM|nr:hypothetical protein SCHPADRAFT_597762 [Schizopora paradoxa]
MTLPSRGVSGAISDLCMAIVRRDIAEVSSILSVTPHLARKSHDAGFFPIDAAIMTGDIAIVRLILDQPGLTWTNPAQPASSFKPANKELMLITEFCADRRFDIIEGGLSLHYACLRGDVDILKLVVARCARFYVKDSKGWTPYRHCDVRTEEGRLTLQAYQEAKKKHLHVRALYSDNPLDLAAKAMSRLDLELLRLLLNKHPNLTTKIHPTQGWILLHLAVMNDTTECVKVLLEYDKKAANLQDKWDDSDTRILYYLDRANEPFHYVQSCTALHHACIVGNMKTIKMLLEAGADWTIKDSKGRLAETFLRDSHGDERAKEFKVLCEEEAAKRKRKVVEGSGLSAESGEDESTSAKITKLEEVLGRKMIGQQGPVRTVASAIRLREHGWVDPGRPLVMLFLGSSGVGKTELAKQIALYMNEKDGTGETGNDLTELESEAKFIRLDMSEFQESHSVSNLTGSPKGYVGYNDGGGLSSQLKKNPKAVVLLDEIEKAHPDVLTVFLQVFDDGRITDKKEGVVYCKDSIFVMTSNLASDEIKEAAPRLRQLLEDTKDRPEVYHRTMNKFNKDIHPVLKRSLRRDELLGRINQIVVFLPLSEDEIRDVIIKEMQTWKKRATEKHHIDLSWCDEVVANLVQGYNVNFGVRSVVNEVRRVAVQQVAESQISGKLKKGWLAYLTTNEFGDVEIKCANPRDGLGRRNGCRYYVH